MFEVGFTEILLILGLALIVLGPERLPRLAAQLGRWVGRARSMARQFREQLDREVDAVDLSRQFNDGRDHSDAGGPPEPPSSAETTDPQYVDPLTPPSEGDATSIAQEEPSDGK